MRALPLILLSLSLTSTSVADTKPILMTVATVAPADSPWSALLTLFKEAVEKRAPGRIKIKPMLGGALGDENETVTKCSRGQIQAVGSSTGALATKIPELNLVELPFLFRTAEEADEIVDKVLTVPYEKLFRDRGLVLGFWNENGFRHFATRDGAVERPEDLKGKKMRSQENPVHLEMYKALGASAMPIPATEVPQALATGNVDGFDQATLYMIAAGWQKSIKHVTLSEHIYQPAAIVFNKKWFDGLPADLQKILIEEGRALQGKGRKAVRAILPDLNEILVGEKVAVHTMTKQQRAVFETAVLPVYAYFKKTFGAQAAALLDQVQAELKRLRAERSEIRSRSGLGAS